MKVDPPQYKGVKDNASGPIARVKAMAVSMGLNPKGMRLREIRTALKERQEQNKEFAGQMQRYMDRREQENADHNPQEPVVEHSVEQTFPTPLGEEGGKKGGEAQPQSQENGLPEGASGDIIYHDGSNWVTLGSPGSSGWHLEHDGTEPYWALYTGVPSP